MSSPIRKPNNITIENARFVFRPNFEGRPGPYNKEGDREFNVAIRDDIAEAIAADGWNLKWTKPNPERADEFPPEAYLNVAVRMGYKPPKIVLIQDGHETEIDEKTVALLDQTEFEMIDMVIRPYVWNQPDGSSGIKAYLQTFYGTVPSDPIRAKYAARQGE